MKKRTRIDVDNVRTKAVESPSAQTATLCQPDKSLEALCTDILTKVEALKVASPTIALFARLQLTHALRVSELLSAGPGDIDFLGRLLIKSAKGGRPRVCDTGIYSSLFLDCKANGCIPWAGWTRFAIHRLYLRYGIQLSLAGSKKRTTTHALRHLSTLLLDDKTNDLSFAQSLLAHSSTTNAHIYAKRKHA